MPLKNVFVTIVFLLLFSFHLFSANYGKIGGVVTDSKTGEPLAGVNVIVEGLNIGAATDGDGYYMILQVSPGAYSVVCEYIGYQSVRVENIVVRADRVADVYFKMTEKMLEMDAIVVVADRPAVERDNAATTHSVGSEDIEVLPVTTVNEILQTQPGVINSDGMHFRGGRSGEVVYYMDGVPIVNPLTSNINSSEIINKDAISEMQVISGTYSAEYGNAMSGIINISTKEGGDRFDFNLDVKSSAAGIEEASTDNNRNVFRGSMSGPLWPGNNKTGFFISANHDKRDSYLPWGYNEENSVFAKISDRHFDNFKLFTSINMSTGEHKNYKHSYKYIPDQYWYKPRTDAQIFQFGMTHTLKKNLFYNLNLFYHKNHYDSGDYDYHGLSPAYSRDVNREFYLQSFVSSFEEDDQTTMGMKGDVLWQANKFHEFKAGFEMRQHEIDRFYISSPYYDDHTLDDYTEKPKEVSAFIQDKIDFSSIILSIGLRYDMMDANADYWESPYDAYNDVKSGLKASEIHDQISPRLAISYPVSSNTVFHFGFGHYFQRPDYQFMYTRHARTNSTGVYDANENGIVDYQDNVIMNLLTGNGRFGNTNLKPEKTIAYEFGVSKQMFKDYVANVSIYSKNITNLLGTRTYFSGEFSESGEYYWESWTRHINEDFAYNNGIEIQLRKKTGKNLFGEINYTFAVAEGSSSGPLQRVGAEEANKQSLQFFPLDFDQRHTVNANAVFRFNNNEGFRLGGVHLLENVRFSMIFNYGSGLPYTKGIRGPAEPYEINNKRLPASYNFDLKIDKTIEMGSFTLRPYLEIYNLFDENNVLFVDPDTGKPDYSYGHTKEWAANPLNWSTPRIIYVGIRFNFN